MHRFNMRPELKDKHAFLSASKYHWLNDDDDKLVERYGKSMDAALGTRLHALAAELIALRINLPNTSQTLNLYVNDCIGYRMSTEQVLFYSYNAFGTADAIKFSDGLLQIFDLKNGTIPAKVYQLEIYAALFCLEYKKSPRDIDFDLRIYQNDDIALFETDPQDILYVMSRIIDANKIVEKMKEV